MRSLSAIIEQTPGKSIIIQNMTGATGSIATQYVFDAHTDGYTILMDSENLNDRAGGLTWEVGAFITDVTGALFVERPHDSDASAKTA